MQHKLYINLTQEQINDLTEVSLSNLLKDATAAIDYLIDLGEANIPEDEILSDNIKKVLPAVQELEAEYTQAIIALDESKL